MAAVASALFAQQFLSLDLQKFIPPLEISTPFTSSLPQIRSYPYPSWRLGKDLPPLEKRTGGTDEEHSGKNAEYRLSLVKTRSNG